MLQLEKTISNEKKSYHQRLHDVFITCGYKNYTPLETGVALLIDDIIREIREELKNKKV